MHEMTFNTILSFLISIIVFGCTNTSLTENDADLLERNLIKSTLHAYENAWNNHDQAGLLALLDDEFVIWARGRRKILYTKKEYAFELKYIMIKRRAQNLRFNEPTIWLKGDKATVLMPISLNSRNIRNTFHMIRKNEKWFFLDSEF